MTELKDWRGVPIEVGSVIVYPGRTGSTVWVNEATVEEIATRESWGHTIPVLRVRRTRDTWVGFGSWKITGKTSTLTRVDLVTVVGAP